MLWPAKVSFRVAPLLLALSAAVCSYAQQQTTVYSYSVPSGGYAPNGNVMNYTDSVTGQWSMQYDNLNRLQNANAGSGYYSGLTLQWQYDSFGNRLSQTPSGSPAVAIPGPISATYDPNNRILTSSVPGMGPSSYDAAGNVIFDGINNIAYDGENRVCAVLNSMNTLTQYLYNAEGQRVAKGHSASGNALACPVPGDFVPDEKYILGQSGEQITELTVQPTGQDQWQRTNIYANGQLLATYDQEGSQLLHFNVTDPLGTKRVQTSASGVPELSSLSLPYGDGLTPVGSGQDATEHHFTGKERDTESGLDYFGARYYGSSMGRWMSPDWADKPEAVPYSSLDNPQSLNLYGYVLNNPLSKADPDGHAGCPPDCSTGNNVVDFFLGAANAFSSDNLAGAGRVNQTSPGGQLGAQLGDVGAMVQGAAQVVLGTGGNIAGVALDATGVGAAVGVPVNVVSTAVTVEGAGAATMGAVNLMKASGPKAANAPGITAGGQATDEHGNKLGPSGEKQINSTSSNTREGANNKALNEGSSSVNHNNPKDGQGPHFHAGDAQGNKKPSSTHHEYPQ